MVEVSKEKILDALENGRNNLTNPLSQSVIDIGRIAYALLEENEKLKQELLTDPLTSIPSYRAYKEQIEPELLAYFDTSKERRKFPTDYILLIADLDNLKRINDTEGHLQGDKAIIESAQILKNSIRNQDWVSRHGDHADEFIVVIRLGAEDDAAYVREQLFERIQLLSSVSHIAGISISVGAAIASECDGFSIMRDSAETAMYQSKRSKKE